MGGSGIDASPGTTGEYHNSHTNPSFRNDDGNYEIAHGSSAKGDFEEIELNEYENNNQNGLKKKDPLTTSTSPIDSSLSSSDIEPTSSLPPVPFFKLFRYASKTDKILMGIAIISAMIGGLSIPCMIILFGDLANTFVSNDLNNDVCNYAQGCCTANLT